MQIYVERIYTIISHSSNIKALRFFMGESKTAEARKAEDEANFISKKKKVVQQMN